MGPHAPRFTSASTRAALAQPTPCPSPRHSFCSLGCSHSRVMATRCLVHMFTSTCACARTQFLKPPQAHTNMHALPSLIHVLTSAHMHRNSHFLLFLVLKRDGKTCTSQMQTSHNPIEFSYKEELCPSITLSLQQPFFLGQALWLRVQLLQEMWLRLAYSFTRTAIFVGLI